MSMNIKLKYISLIAFAAIFVGIGCLLEKLEEDRFVIETIPPASSRTEDDAAAASADSGDSDEQTDEGSETAANTATSAPDEISEDGKININTAPIETLCLLDGIGESMAQRIVDYRTEHGNFENIEELALVSGIGEKKLEKLRDFITVE